MGPIALDSEHKHLAVNERQRPKRPGKQKSTDKSERRMHIGDGVEALNYVC